MSAEAGVRRRDVLKRVALGAAATALAVDFPAPALAQGKLEWKMATAWPKGSGGVGSGADRLAQRITEMSDGRLTVKAYSGGELVPPLDVFTAVGDGRVEMGHDAAAYHLDRHRQLPFFSAVPFGLTANEQAGWIHYGGGQALWDELAAGFGVKPFMAGNTGAQMLGWFRQELKSVEDFKGLKMGMTGLGGEVIRKLGATPLLLPGADIFAALQNGTLDAADWIGPSNDLALGLHQVASFYYGPGFQEPDGALQLSVNKALYDGLPRDLQTIIAVAAQAEHDAMWAEYTLRNGEALATLIGKGTKVSRVPNEMLIAIGNATGDMLAEERDKADALGKKIFTSFLKARQALLGYTRIGEQAIANARTLAFKYLE